MQLRTAAVLPVADVMVEHISPEVALGTKYLTTSGVAGFAGVIFTRKLDD